MSSKRVEIEIDHLVLQGIDPRHRARIAETVRRELAQLIATGGMPPGWAHGEAGVHGIPRIEVNPTHSPARIGASVARAIYRGGK
jgi:hypothetical protein